MMSEIKSNTSENQNFISRKDYGQVINFLMKNLLLWILSWNGEHRKSNVNHCNVWSNKREKKWETAGNA